jgi:hypothetical protein
MSTPLVIWYRSANSHTGQQLSAALQAGQMAASDHVSEPYENRLQPSGRPQMRRIDLCDRELFDRIEDATAWLGWKVLLLRTSAPRRRSPRGHNGSIVRKRCWGERA